MYWLNFVREFYRPTPAMQAEASVSSGVSSARKRSPSSRAMACRSAVVAVAVSPHAFASPKVALGAVMASPVLPQPMIESVAGAPVLVLTPAMPSPLRLVEEGVSPSHRNKLMEVPEPELGVQEEMLQTIRALEAKLEALSAQLAITEHGRTAFLSSMSHELRTPLNAIMGFSDMMKTGVFGDIKNPTYAEYVEHIHDSGSLLLTKINDLLDIASIEADGMTLDEVEFRLENMLEDLLSMHSRGAFARQQTLQIDAIPHVVLYADRSKLLCALSHLLGNALRHSVDGATIILRVRAHYEDGVTLSIHDAGEGIPQRQLTSIHTALRKDQSYRAIEPGGLGIGLALAKEIASAHDATIMLDSLRHRGTVSSITLPPQRVKAGLPHKRVRMR